MVVFSTNALYTLQKDSLTSNREIHTGKRYVTTAIIHHSYRSASQSAINLIRSEKLFVVPERDTAGEDAAAEASAMRASMACPADANDACAVAAIAAGFFLSFCS